MSSYGMGEVERILGLPASTLRHWERELGLLSPRKDQFGRRRFTVSDIRLLIRLKHLALDRGLGLSTAGRVLVDELGSPQTEARARIAQLRGEFITLYFASVESRRALDGRPSSPKI